MKIPYYVVADVRTRHVLTSFNGGVVYIVGAPTGDWLSRWSLNYTYHPEHTYAMVIRTPTGILLEAPK